jgi:putative toxin-antitoxin system antitoxin component (TIGR02293 family)
LITLTCTCGDEGIALPHLRALPPEHALSFERIADLIDIPRRTMTRRKREGRFLPDESDRLLRASRLLGKTLELFEGDMDAAGGWLTTAQPGLGGSVPLDIARSELGAREVERLVSRLEHGVFS